MVGSQPLRDKFRTQEIAGVKLINIVFAVAIVALILFASFASEAFLTQRNIVSISRQIVTNGLLSLGMLLVILTGGVDLSVGSIVAFAGLLSTGLQEHMPFPAAILIALLMGVAVGAFNGIIIAHFKLQPFIVTLATMGSVRGLLYIYSETPTYPVDPMFRALLGGGFIGPFPVPALIFAASAASCLVLFESYDVGARRICNRREPGGRSPRWHQCAAPSCQCICGERLSCGTRRRAPRLAPRNSAAIGRGGLRT